MGFLCRIHSTEPTLVQSRENSSSFIMPAAVFVRKSRLRMGDGGEFAAVTKQAVDSHLCSKESHPCNHINSLLLFIKSTCMLQSFYEKMLEDILREDTGCSHI